MPPFCSTWLQHGHTEQPLSLWSFQDLFSPQAPSWLDHQSPWESFWWKVTFVNSSHCTWSPNLGGVLLQVQLALTAGWPRHRTTFLLPGRSSMIVVDSTWKLSAIRNKTYQSVSRTGQQLCPTPAFIVRLHKIFTSFRIQIHRITELFSFHCWGKLGKSSTLAGTSSSPGVLPYTPR